MFSLTGSFSSPLSSAAGSLSSDLGESGGGSLISGNGMPCAFSSSVASASVNGAENPGAIFLAMTVEEPVFSNYLAICDVFTACAVAVTAQGGNAVP